jgi:hypothetical protein
MYRNFMHGNREILQLTLSTCVLKVRVENPTQLLDSNMNQMPNNFK